MPDISPYDINSGRTFIPQCVQDHRFHDHGVVYGKSGDLWWAVIDPRRHPLCVWKRSGNADDDYARSARALSAAVFTNGPMMDKFSKWEVRKAFALQMLFDGINWAVIGAVVGFFLGGPWGALIGGLAGAVFGFFIGYEAAKEAVFKDWVPFGRVHGTTHSVDDVGRGFGGLVYLGRTGSTLDTYAVGDGNPPQMLEVIGGTIPIVRHFFPTSATKGAANYYESFESLSQRAGLVAWGIVPIDVDPAGVEVPRSSDGTPANISERVMLKRADFGDADLSVPGSNEAFQGVLVCVGNAGTAFMATAGATLAHIGTRDAVALDGSDSVMMGDYAEMMLREPPAAKQLIQKYGFYTQ
ncbi:DUF456 domain-containing protein [Ramlibacter sp. G-1-2-2]|uniref:DUF456 domain-containing protein n=1 Tax=Ramlibacter agri TaxID=2728837 RepID=A0A848GXI7_9BURK|nr:DUF456 domain-containing protein [Ramlibacter agri]NML43305.1 DUF456 domain-containing protein [Ramlibacter agri]